MPQFNILSPQEVESLHHASLRILSETGFLLTHAGTRRILTDAGATSKGDRVQLPPELIEKCIASAGKKVSVKGRGGGVKTLGDGSLYFHNLGGARDVYNSENETKRYAVVQDVRDATRLLDALENCHTITPFFTPQDVPGALMSLAMYRHAMPFTTKPLQGPGVQYASEVKYAVRMAEVIGVPAEVLTLSLSPVSPLALPVEHAIGRGGLC